MHWWGLWSMPSLCPHTVNKKAERWIITVQGRYDKEIASVQLLGHVWLFMTPWTADCQASLSITNFWSLLKLMSIESVMPSNHLILCHPFLLLPSIFPSITVFSNESVLPSGDQRNHQSIAIDNSNSKRLGPVYVERPGKIASRR